MNDKDFRAEVQRIQNKFYDTLAKSEEKAPEQYKEVIGEGGLGTPAEAIKKKGDAYDFLYSGGERESLKGAVGDIIGNIGKPEEQQKEIRDIKLKDTIVDSIIGTTADMWKDVSTALVLRGKTGKELDKSLTNVMDISQRALERAEQETDPEIKARLQKVAFEGMNEVSKQRGEIDKLWSESKDEPYWARALGVGSETAALGVGLLSLKDLGKQAITKLGEKAAEKSTKAVTTIAGETGETLTKKPSLTAKALQKAKELSPTRRLAEKQLEEAGKVTTQINTDEMLRPLQEAAKLDPDIATGLEKYGPGIKNIKTPTDLVNALQQFGDQAFTKGGDIASSTKSKIFYQLWKGGIEQLKTVAPEAYKYRQLLALTFQLPKTAGRWLFKTFLMKGIGFGF